MADSRAAELSTHFRANYFDSKCSTERDADIAASLLVADSFAAELSAHFRAVLGPFVIAFTLICGHDGSTLAGLNQHHVLL